MKKGKLALGRGLKELLPTTLKEEGTGEIGTEELLEELKKVRDRIEALGYPTAGIDGLLKREGLPPEEVKRELKMWRNYLVSLTRLETVLRQMDALKMTSQAASYRGRVNAGEEPEAVLEEAERELKKAVLKRTRKKRVPEDEISEVQKMIEESREGVQRGEPGEGVEEEAVKKIEELSRSLEELTRLVETGVEGVELEVERAKEEEKGVEEPATEEMRVRRFFEEVQKLKEDGFFVGEIELLYDEKGIEEAERELEEFKRRAERMKEIQREMEAMDLTGVEREASLIRIKLKYPNLLEEVEEDLRRLKELLKGETRVPEARGPSGEEESVEGLLEKAKKLYISGELLKAKELFERALELDPQNPTARFMIRRINMRL